VIQNNYIGIDVGSSVFALTSPGIWLNNVDECQIGGNWANGETNVISGNWPNDGITLQYSSGNYITGNYIGTNTGGTAAAGNNCGIRLWRSQGNTIGGPKSGPFIVLANVVAGNSGGQIVLSEAPGNSVVGNYIGLNALGSSTIAGGGDSVVLNNSSGCLIGGQTKNIICGPAGASGVSITSDSHGNTLAGNWIGVLANGAAPSATLAAGISLSNNANNNRVGLQSGGQGNLIANAIAGIIVDGAGTTKNGLYGNTVCATTNPIILSNNGNIAKSAPIINGAVAGVVSGVAQAGDYVEVFKAEPLSGKNGGSLVWLGWGTAGAGGAWTVNVSGIAAGDYVCATATDSSRNTSGFSLNFLVPQPPSPTFTPTPTNSPTTTPTPTFTPTLSPFLTPTTSPTPGGIATVLPTATPDLGANFILYPNPAGDEMFLRMNLEEAGDVRASFYNINGDGVSVVSDSLPSGPGHILRWNCGHAAPGVYLVLVTKGSTVLFHAKAVVVR
jgi:hypothetical protein